MTTNAKARQQVALIDLPVIASLQARLATLSESLQGGVAHPSAVQAQLGELISIVAALLAQW